MNFEFFTEISLLGFNLTSLTRKIPNSKRTTFFPIDQSSLSNNRAWAAAPGENTPKIRWHKHRKKFTVDTFWFVLEPLASRTRARTSVSRRYSNQLPAVRSGKRADARTPSSSSGRICAFSSWVSLTGEVLPVPDRRVCADTPDRQWNQGKTLDYRSHIVSTPTHLWSRSRRCFLPPPFSFASRGSALFDR